VTPNSRLRPLLRPIALACCALLLLQDLAWSQELPSELPSLGEVAGDDLSPRDERRYGEQIMQEYIRRDPSFLSDPPSVEYINRLGYQLVAASAARHIDFEFFLIKDPTINAFALPGGFIGVHTALVLTAQDESELASVLAHEIGHVQQRHLARSLARQRDSTMIALGSILLALLASRSGGQGTEAALAVGQAAAISRQLAFSRDDEREADRVGFGILVNAGFDPQGMPDFFGRMQQGMRAYASVAPAYLQTHPLTVERIADMQGRVRDQHTHQHADGIEFQLVRARLRVLQDDTSLGLRDALATFQDQIAHHSANSEMAPWYGSAFALLKMHEPQKALEAARTARRLAKDPSAMLDSMVELASYEAAASDAGRESALSMARDNASRFPLSRTLATDYADLLQRSGRHGQAIAFLRDQLALSHSDPDFYRLLGASHAALEHHTLQHQATAEMYLLMGSTGAAVEQLQLAHKTADADFYTMTEVDARLRQLTEQLREEREEEAKNRGR
jgi:predicted Zn-dependent protease